METLMGNQKCCTTCQYVYVNTMSDERYCDRADGEPIKLRRKKKRPDWCPLINNKEGANK
jgi:hypothetical protein